MTPETLNRKLADGDIVTLKTSAWEEVSGAFPEVERHDTFLAGDLVIVRGEAGPVAVEAPSPRDRVLRLLPEARVQAFVRDRMDTYERMWDGCGCKVAYHEPWPEAE